MESEQTNKYKRSDITDGFIFAAKTRIGIDAE